jgi:HEAT repeat protein
MGRRRVNSRRRGVIHTVFFAVCLVFSFPVFGEDPILQSYQQNFSRADIAAKTEILKDAATDDRADEFIGPLYEFALQFALRHVEILKDDPELIHMTVIAARGAGTSDHKGSVATLWRLFSGLRDSRTRVEILGALGSLGKGDSQIIENLNDYLAGQNRLYRSGMDLDYPVISACVAALAELGDSSSYPALFSVLTTGYPEVIVMEASGALDVISGNYKQFLLDVILKNPPGEKLAAFRAGMNSGRFSPADKGQLAEIALDQSLGVSSGGGEALSALRYAAVLALTRLQWTRASALAIRGFYRIQTDFQQGAAPKERFLESVACLGAMGSSDAALALALQLGLINAQTEKTGVYDEDITLAVVRALGAIGDKAAFDYLLYISYLNYPDHIQAAAKEALNRLKW